MKILIIGSGGREYAISQKLLLQNEGISLYYIGNSENAGLNDIVTDKFIGNILDNTLVLQKIDEWNIEFTIVGPETPLANGLIDFLQLHNKLCFGPKRVSAQIETSKTFARNFMQDNGMNDFSPNFLFLRKKEERTQLDCLKTFIRTHDGNFVIKPDGPCGGKGVKVSGDHFDTIDEGLKYINEIEVPIVIEEKLIGEEFSFMTFTDGITCKHTIPVKDYKRAFENDQGPNTGSMGSISGANGRLWFLDDDDIETAKKINELIICDLHLQTKEYFQGILYGSFIKTKKGIKVIEFNARFGDPECINLFSLMQSDLLELMMRCSNQTLHEFNGDIVFGGDACVFKYLVPNGYPDSPIKGEVVTVNESYFENKDMQLIFGNISKTENNEYIELGSRTIGVVRLAESIEKAAELVNNDATYIEGPLHFRKDIGLINSDKKITINCDIKRDEDCHVKFVIDLYQQMQENNSVDAYAAAGVDIDEGNRVVSEIKSAVESTFTPLVCSKFGDFAGMITVPPRFSNFNSYNHDQVLVASTDGVGTKSILVLETFGPEVGYDMLGQDIVHHCINDVLVKGAKPYFFLDCFASASIKAEHVKYFVQGVAKACKANSCALLGGETAEMPDVYQPGKTDLVGTMVGIVQRNEIINGKENIKEGDVCVGIPSSGPHTNGYTLLRKLVKEHTIPNDIVKQMCATHRNYYPNFQEMKALNIDIHGMCHLTGGGFAENPKRVLPDKFDISWYPLEYSPLFKYVQSIGNISDAEMRKIFNCGIGMLVFMSRDDAAKLSGNDDYHILGDVVLRK